MINVEFLIVTYLIGLAVDWIFQVDWQAVNKSKWGKDDNKKESAWALLSHALTYALWTIAIVRLFVRITNLSAIIAFIVLFVTHTLIDTRIPVKWIMKFKGMKEEQINDYTNYGFMHIGIDHRLHELVILILSIFIK